MPEALSAVITAVFERTDAPVVLWECVVGNRPSLRVAQKTGFRFTGRRTGMIAGRDGVPVAAWTGRLAREDDRAPQPGWPA